MMTIGARGFETLAVHAGQEADPATGAGGAHLPDNIICIQGFRNTLRTFLRCRRAEIFIPG